MQGKKWQISGLYRSSSLFLFKVPCNLEYILIVQIFTISSWFAKQISYIWLFAYVPSKYLTVDLLNISTWRPIVGMRVYIYTYTVNKNLQKILRNTEKDKIQPTFINHIEVNLF